MPVPWGTSQTPPQGLHNHEGLYPWYPWPTEQGLEASPEGQLKALVWFWLIDETLSANLVYQSDYEIGSTTPSDEAMEKIMTMMMAW